MVVVVMVEVQFHHLAILYLASMEPATSSTTQQVFLVSTQQMVVMVVQSYTYQSHNTVLSFKGISNFINNSADWGGAISTISNSVFSFNGISNFINNSAEWGGAIHTLFRNTLTFNGTIYIANNGHHGGRVNTHSGYTYGGGMYLGVKCTFSILPNTTVYWENNHASLGGAIYVSDASPTYKLLLDTVRTKRRMLLSTPISSDPLQVCSCKNNLPECRWPFYQFPHTVYPGEMFKVSVVAVGQRNGTVPSTVISAIDKVQYPAKLLDSEYLQQTDNTCTKLKYTVFSLSQFVAIVLHAEGSPCSNIGNYLLIILVNLNHTCPPGFSISESEKICVCHPRLTKFTHQCTITNGIGQVTRESHQHFWVGYDHS